MSLNDCNTITNPYETNAKIVECYDEDKVKTTLYKQIVGSLRYLCNNRPDFYYVASTITRIMSEPMKSHIMFVRRILKYLKEP